MRPSNAQARWAAIQAGRKILESRPVYLDTETTGLDWRAEVVEVCVLDHDGRVLVDSLVRPTTPIPPEATRVHGIVDAMVRPAPTWAELWPQVAGALEGRTVAIYNADFDLKMIAQSHRRHGLAWQAGYLRAECLMKLYARFYGQVNPAYGTFRWQPLADAARQCGIALPNAHRARDDALLARAVLEHMASRER